MVIYASNLLPQEQDRMMKAEVKVTKRERARKGVIDITITVDAADGLLRKVWHQLERACTQEGVKRYQIEASSQLTPVRVKPPSMFMKARTRVKEIMDEEEKAHSEMKRQEKARKENVQTAENDQEEVQVLGESMVGEPATEEEDVSPGIDKTSQHVETEVQRIKKPIWLPPEGYGRCGRSCEGCIAKCAEQSLENCQNCHLNSLKGGKSNPCNNRKECLELKPKNQTTVRGRSTGQKNQKKGLVLNINRSDVREDRSPSASSVVKDRVDELEAKDSKKEEVEQKTGEKKDREPGSTPEFPKKQHSKIAVPTTNSKEGPGSTAAPGGLPKPLIK